MFFLYYKNSKSSNNTKKGEQYLKSKQQQKNIILIFVSKKNPFTLTLIPNSRWEADFNNKRWTTRIDSTLVQRIEKRTKKTKIIHKSSSRNNRKWSIYWATNRTATYFSKKRIERKKYLRELRSSQSYFLFCAFHIKA